MIRVMIVFVTVFHAISITIPLQFFHFIMWLSDCIFIEIKIQVFASFFKVFQKPHASPKNVTNQVKVKIFFHVILPMFGSQRVCVSSSECQRDHQFTLSHDTHSFNHASINHDNSNQIYNKLQTYKSDQNFASEFSILLLQAMRL